VDPEGAASSARHSLLTIASDLIFSLTRLRATSAALPPSPKKSVDAGMQIRLFGKLKLAKCARAERRPGFFCVSAEERLFFHCY
jgi:hypothetical protein